MSCTVCFLCVLLIYIFILSFMFRPRAMKFSTVLCYNFNKPTYLLISVYYTWKTLAYFRRSQLITFLLSYFSEKYRANLFIVHYCCQGWLANIRRINSLKLFHHMFTMFSLSDLTLFFCCYFSQVRWQHSQVAVGKFLDRCVNKSFQITTVKEWLHGAWCTKLLQKLVTLSFGIMSII